jgi:hypothetical protein
MEKNFVSSALARMGVIKSPMHAPSLLPTLRVKKPPYQSYLRRLMWMFGATYYPHAVAGGQTRAAKSSPNGGARCTPSQSNARKPAVRARLRASGKGSPS